jgi:hypothetical protein
MMRLLAGAVGAATVLAGCVQPERATDSLFEKRWPQVSWSQISGTQVEGVRNAYMMMAPGGSVGLFPCSLAVARVTWPADLGSNGSGFVVPAMNPPNEFIDLMELFDDVWEVSEAFPVTQPGQMPRYVEPADLVARARRVGASLCLVYGPSDNDESDTEIRGALYDTRDGALIAAIHARARVDLTAVVPPPRGRHENDLRHIDSRVLAHERFSQLLSDCVADLIDHDRSLGRQPPPPGWTPAPAVEPLPWRPLYKLRQP